MKLNSQLRVEEFDLESMKESLGDSTVELPDEINVYWQDSRLGGKTHETEIAPGV